MPDMIKVSVEMRLVGLGAPHRISMTLRDHELNDAQVEAWGELRNPLRRGEVAIMHGPYGVGKSTLAVYFMRSCVSKRKSCLMYTVAGLMASQKNWFNAYNTKAPSPIERAKSTYFLVLDEVAMEGTEYDRTQLAEIVKHRYDNQLPTLLITNIVPQHLTKALTGAVMDRVRDGAIVGMAGESMRGNTNGR